MSWVCSKRTLTCMPSIVHENTHTFTSRCTRTNDDNNYTCRRVKSTSFMFKYCIYLKIENISMHCNKCCCLETLKQHFVIATSESTANLHFRLYLLTRMHIELPQLCAIHCLSRRLALLMCLVSGNYPCRRKPCPVGTTCVDLAGGKSRCDKPSRYTEMTYTKMTCQSSSRYT